MSLILTLVAITNELSGRLFPLVIAVLPESPINAIPTTTKTALFTLITKIMCLYVYPYVI